MGFLLNDEEIKDENSAVVQDDKAPVFEVGLFDQGTEDGLRAFQSFYHLPLTGVLDATTIEHVRSPRCGLPDHPFSRGLIFSRASSAESVGRYPAT